MENTDRKFMRSDTMAHTLIYRYTKAWGRSNAQLGQTMQTFTIQCYKRVYIRVMERRVNGKLSSLLVWTRDVEQAAIFSKQEYAQEFIENNNLMNCKVVQRLQKVNP